jgi:hypothetical protein
VRVLRWAGQFWTGVLALIVLLAALLLGLRLLLPLFAAPPTLLAATPADGAAGVPPRARPSLRFDGPMNPRSVERALALRPAVAWLPIWSADRATLTISPTESLRPDTAYTLTLDTLALSQRFRAFGQPLELHFRTAPAPTVIGVLPANGAADVPLDAPISIHFSRTIVPADALMRPMALPELRFDPPLDGSVTWLDQATALFRPTTPLHPGTLYRATIDAALSDSAGVQLNRPFAWSFSTPVPSVLDIAPSDGATAVAPRATLEITLSQPLDLASLRASLLITPNADGDLALRDLPDGRQLAQFAPYAGWLPATNYTIALRAGAVPAGGNLPLLTPRRWSFTTAPQPTLTGRFPGEGQTLPPGQEIRLIFNTPIDAEAVRAALQLTPTAEILRVTNSEAEVRIAADVRAGTPYTITLPATLNARNGIPLAQEYRLRFVSAPSGPALALPDAPAHLAQALPEAPADLLIRRTNLSALQFDLYQLDESAVVRTSGFRESDWVQFQPARYGQPLLRSWRVPLADPLNQVVEERVPLSAATGDALPAGAYYLRIRTPEGPQANLLMLSSRARLTLQSSTSPAGANSAGALIWATDTVSGTPIGGLPVALYQSGTLIELNTTDASGLASFSRATGAAPTDLVALADGGRMGVVSSAWGDTGALSRERPRLFFTTDRAAYQPGERVELAGIVRAPGTLSDTLGLARASTISLSVRIPGAAGRIYQEALTIGDTGVFSASLALSSSAPPGTYVATATIGGVAVQAPFVVRPDPPASLDVAVRAPEAVTVAGTPAPVEVSVQTPEGLPVAAATISWTLDAERAPFPQIGDYTFGDAEREPTTVAARGGVGQLGADGRVSLVISDTLAGDLPLRYRLHADATEPAGPSASAEGAFVVAPAPIYTGVRLPSRIFTAAKAGLIELLATTPDGRRAPRARLLVEIYRRTWQRAEEPGPDARPRVVWQPVDKLAFTRSATTQDDGTASLPLTLPSGGVYRLHAGTAADIKTTYSATTVWASAPGFRNWGELPGDQPLLIADRDAYYPGETATLLITTRDAQLPVLLTRSAADGLIGQARTIRAGEPFTITIRPEDAPALTLAMLLPVPTPATSAAAAPAPAQLATTTLAVRDEQALLSVGLVSDRDSYAPGATATLTVTTSDAAGVGLPADLIVIIAVARAAPRATLASLSQADAPPALACAPRRAAAPPRLPTAPPGQVANDPDLAPGVFWSSGLRTNDSGVLTFTIQLPSEPGDLRASIWAAGAGSAGQVQTTLAVTRPFELQIEAPALFRAGDVIELAARIQNTSPVARDIQASLASAGVRLLDNPSPSLDTTLGPGSTTRLSWRAEVLDQADVRLTISTRGPDSPVQVVHIERPILPIGAAEANSGGIALLRDYLDPLTGQPLDPTRLRAGQLVRARLTVVTTEPRRALKIADPLPASAILLNTGDGVGLNDDGIANGQIRLSSEALAPGIYQFSYLMRLVAGGRYAVPPTTAQAAGASGSGNGVTLDVSGD